MLLFANQDTQLLVTQPLVNSPVQSLEAPRAPNVPILVQFTSGNTIVDPELEEIDVVSASAANPSVITTLEPHGFTSGDSITLSGVAGSPQVITSSSVANPTVITSTAHGLTSGDTVTIAGHVGSTPAISGTYIITSTGSNTFTIPVNVTVAGTGGTFTKSVATPDINGAHTITATGDFTFTIPVTVTKAGLGGLATKLTPLNLRWTVKNDQQFDQDPPAASISPGSFVKLGSGNSTVFKGACNFITTALNAVLGVNPPTVSDDKAFVNLMAELSWEGATPSKTKWVRFILDNDLYKTGDGDAISTGGTSGKTAIGNGHDYVTVVFGTALGSANWHFLGTPMVTNLVDGSPTGLVVIGITARTTTGFTVQLSGATDSANYKLEWSNGLD